MKRKHLMNAHILYSLKVVIGTIILIVVSVLTLPGLFSEKIKIGLREGDVEPS